MKSNKTIRYDVLINVEKDLLFTLRWDVEEKNVFVSYNRIFSQTEVEPNEIEIDDMHVVTNYCNNNGLSLFSY